MAAKRSHTRLTNYVELNNFSSVVLYNSAPPKKKGKIYQVERLISRKKVKNDVLYLIKWAGWPLQASTWEPSDNLTNELLRGYERPPKPILTRLEHATRAFAGVILTMLKSRALGNKCLVEIDHDIWRYVVQGKGTACEHRGHILYEKGDFDRFEMLPPNWWYYLTTQGEGKKINFPLKAKAVLSWSPKTHTVNGLESQRFPIEKICISIARSPCNQENTLVDN